MKKNRNIPFGYCMINGKYAVNSGEAAAVKQIFTEYSDGKSLNEIAAKMTVPYHSDKAAQERIGELSRNIDELIKLAAVDDTEQSMADIQKFSNEMTALREFIESERAKQSAAGNDNRQLETVLDMLEKEDFRLNKYGDVAVRHLIEYIKVIDKNTLLVCFKGGFEVRKELNIGN